MSGSSQWVLLEELGSQETVRSGVLCPHHTAYLCIHSHTLKPGHLTSINRKGRKLTLDTEMEAEMGFRGIAAQCLQKLPLSRGTCRLRKLVYTQNQRQTWALLSKHGTHGGDCSNSLKPSVLSPNNPDWQLIRTVFKWMETNVLLQEVLKAFAFDH